MRFPGLLSRIIIAVFLIFIIGVGAAVPFGVQAVGALERAQHSLAAAVHSLSAKRNIGEAAAHLERAAEEFSSAQKNFGRVQYLRAVPWVGRQVKAAYAGVVAAQ